MRRVPNNATRWEIFLSGGASLIVLPLFFLLVAFKSSSTALGEVVENTLASFGTIFLALALLVNLPHFMYSYRATYGRGLPFLRQHFFAMAFLPAAMILTLAFAWANYELPLKREIIAGVNHGFSSLQLGSRIPQTATTGGALVDLLLFLTVASVGWHYAKQTFGITLVFAQNESYPLSSRQRLWLRWSLLFVWWASLLQLHTQTQAAPIVGDRRPFVLLLPTYWHGIASGLIFISVLGSFVFLFIRNLNEHGKNPPPSVIVPWLAFHLWWIPFTTAREFFIYLVPFFHSLQYFPFAWRVEKDRLRDVPRRKQIPSLLSLGALLLAAGAVVQFLPLHLESKMSHRTDFFLIASYVLLNLHHYFLDSIAWRLRDPSVRRALLGDSHDAANNSPALSVILFPSPAR